MRTTRVKLFDLDGKLVREVDAARHRHASAASPASAKTRRRSTRSPASRRRPSIYRYDVATGKSTLFRQPKVDFDPNDYETKQVFYTSKDGTRVPMFITHKKGLKLDGQNPTYPLRLRRLQHLAHARLLRQQPRLDGDGRRLRRGEPARRRRIRPSDGTRPA